MRSSDLWKDKRLYTEELVQADTASLEENAVLLAVPSPIIASVKAVGSQPNR